MDKRHLAAIALTVGLLAALVGIGLWMQAGNDAQFSRSLLQRSEPDHTASLFAFAVAVIGIVVAAILYAGSSPDAQERPDRSRGVQEVSGDSEES